MTVGGDIVLNVFYVVAKACKGVVTLVFFCSRVLQSVWTIKASLSAFSAGNNVVVLSGNLVNVKTLSMDFK
jgi:hypothetical protein